MRFRRPGRRDMSAPKSPGQLRNRSRLRKLECFCCPIDGRTIVYASRSNVAKNAAPRCGACGEQLMFSDVLDCADVQPELVESHPVHVDEQLREMRAANDAERLPDCGFCGNPYRGGICSRCGFATTPRDDCDSLDVQRPRRGTGEYESAQDTRRAPAAPLDRVTYPRNRTVRAKAAARPDTSEGATSDAIPF